jgi:hypothetical protein
MAPRLVNFLVLAMMLGGALDALNGCGGRGRGLAFREHPSWGPRRCGSLRVLQDLQGPNVRALRDRQLHGAESGGLLPMRQAARQRGHHLRVPDNHELVEFASRLPDRRTLFLRRFVFPLLQEPVRQHQNGLDGQGRRPNRNGQVPRPAVQRKRATVERVRLCSVSIGARARSLARPSQERLLPALVWAAHKAGAGLTWTLHRHASGSSRKQPLNRSRQWNRRSRS